jgi:glycogen debranching enzyme
VTVKSLVAVITVLVAEITDVENEMVKRLHADAEIYLGSEETGGPVPYPASCRPQAWSSTSAIALVQMFLGLEVDVPARTITVRPATPSRVGALEVRGLSVAGGALDIAIDRNGRVLDVRAPQGFIVVT